LDDHYEEIMAYFEHRIWDTKYLMIYWTFASILGLWLIFSRLELYKILSWYLLWALLIVIVALGNFAIWKLDRKNK